MEALQFTTIMALLDNHSKRLQLLESALLDYDGFPPDGAEEAPPLPPVDIDRWFVTMTPQEFRDIRQGLLLTQRELASELGYRHKIRISEYEARHQPSADSSAHCRRDAVAGWSQPAQGPQDTRLEETLMSISKRAMGVDGDDPLDAEALPWFRTGDKVWKSGSGYEGPGEVVVGFNGSDGKRRYVVAHQIDGGTGELLHIYAEGQLTKL